MKKFLLALAVMLVLGAGCSQISGQQNWYLTFDLPIGWQMTKTYPQTNNEKIIPSTEVSRSDNEIFIQNSRKAVVIDDRGIDNSKVPPRSYVALNDGYVQIRVLRLDPPRVLSADAEKLADNIYKVKVCDEGGECQQGGRYNYDYYYNTDAVSYEFMVYAPASQLDKVERIIKSAVPAIDSSQTQE